MRAGEKNAYWCEDCRGYIVTIDRDDGLMPMFLACRVKGDPTDPHNDCSGGRVFTEFHDFLSLLAMIDDPGVRAAWMDACFGTGSAMFDPAPIAMPSSRTTSSSAAPPPTCSATGVMR